MEEALLATHTGTSSLRSIGATFLGGEPAKNGRSSSDCIGCERTVELTGVAVQPKPLAIFKQQLDAGRSLFNKLLGKFSHSKTHS